MNDNTDWPEKARLSGLVFLTNDEGNHDDPPEWHESRTVLNERRSRHSCLVVRHADNSLRKTIVVLGGMAGPQNETVNSVLLWNPENGNWCQGPSMIEARVELTAVVCGDNIYAMGGRNSSGEVLNSIERISIQELLHSWTLMDSSASNTATTSAWHTFHCCLGKKRADAKAVAVQDRYIVVAGGDGDDSESSVLDSVEIFDTQLPYLRFPFAGPCLNFPRDGFQMEIVQNRIFVINPSWIGDSDPSVEYLDFDPSCFDTTSRGVRSVELPSTSMSWKVHEDRTISNLEAKAVVRVGSCLVLLWPGFVDDKTVFDTKRNISWQLPATDSLDLPDCPCIAVSLASGILYFDMSKSGPRGLWLGLVDKQSLLFHRLLNLSNGQIQSLIPRRQTG